jgi:hypothetical protein
MYLSQLQWNSTMLWYRANHTKKTPPLGLFRKICASIVVGEILQEIQGLRVGEKHPMILFLDQRNKLILSTEFHNLYD